MNLTLLYMRRSKLQEKLCLRKREGRDRRSKVLKVTDL